MAYWRDLPGKIVKLQNGFGGGINENVSPLLIAENQASAMQNLIPNDAGSAKVRKGRTALGTNLGAALDYLGAHASDHLLAAVGGALYKWDGASWGAVGAGLTVGAAGDSCEFMGYTWYVNGSEAKKWNGTVYSAISGIPSGVKFIKQDDNRLWALKDGTAYHSALRNGEDWSTALDSGILPLENPRGESNTSLQVFGGNVMIFCDHSFTEIYGTGPENYQMVEGSNQVGCIAHRTFVEIRGRAYWLGHDGVYSYVGGVAPTKISQAVEKTLGTLNWSSRAKANAWVDGDLYVVAIPTGSNTEADTILAFDTVHGTWWVEDLAGVYPRQVVSFGSGLYNGSFTGVVNQITGTSDAGAAIPWSWTTGARQEGYSPLDVLRVFQVAELPTGSTLTLSVSGTVDQNDFTEIGTMTAGTGYQKQRFIFSPSAAANTDWVRLRVSGTGPVTLHELLREVRVKPLV